MTFLEAFAVTGLFALAGFALRGVNRSGAIAGFVSALLLYVCAGPKAFGMLVALFVITFVATLLGRSRKLNLGTAERPEGRNASQVVANVGIAALFAVLYGHYARAPLIAACAAALSEAAADTVSSECGQALHSSPRLVTTGARVPPGSNGAISLPGTVCGAAAALAMTLVAAWAGMVAVPYAWAVTGAALAGMFLDSILGATLERPGGLNNDAVNLFGTLFAAFLAYWWVR